MLHSKRNLSFFVLLLRFSLLEKRRLNPSYYGRFSSAPVLFTLLVSRNLPNIMIKGLFALSQINTNFAQCKQGLSATKEIYEKGGATNE